MVFMEKETGRDLTVGRPGPVLWRFCLPLFGSIIFQQLYNIADSLVAGRFIGENALAAVGNSYEVTLIFLAFAFGCNIGCSVVVSQYYGAKENRSVITAVDTAMLSSAVVCALLMVLGMVFSGPLLELIHTPEEVFADSQLYLDTLELIKEQNSLDWAVLMITDILKEHSVLLCTNFKLNMHLQYRPIADRIYDMPGVLSRKKQLLPEILSTVDMYL